MKLCQILSLSFLMMMTLWSPWLTLKQCQCGLSKYLQNSRRLNFLWNFSSDFMILFSKYFKVVLAFCQRCRFSRVVLRVYFNSVIQFVSFLFSLVNMVSSILATSYLVLRCAPLISALLVKFERYVIVKLREMLRSMNYILSQNQRKEKTKIDISSIQKNLKDAITLSKMNVGTFVVATPSYKGQKFNQSKVIDFLFFIYKQSQLAQGKQKKDSLFIYSFDVTIESDLSSKKTAATEFWTEKIIDHNKITHNYQVYIQHIFVGSSRSIPKRPKIQKDKFTKLNVNYVDWDNIIISETNENRLRVQLFNLARRICSLA